MTREALSVLARRFFEELARINRLPSNTRLRYSVDLMFTDDGTVYLGAEECIPVDPGAGC